MKKRILFLIFLVFTFALNLVLADNSTDIQKVSDAYKCLSDKINEKGCPNLHDNERIFAVLATGACKNELINNMDSEGCWPKGRCNVETTAQAILALHRRGTNTEKSQNWLLEQKIIPPEITWLLQIESNERTTCSIDYDGDSYQIIIGEDKKIDRSAGGCLSLSPGGYWLQINPICHDEEFEIRCDKQFFTNLLFRKTGSQTIHVIDEVHAAPEYGTTFEKINSFCFSTGLNCDYISNAWATMVLDIVGKDISSFMVYLTTMEKREYFPEPFLYTLTGDLVYKTRIMDQQINKEYWKVVDNRYYDTALALLPFQGQDFNEKNSAKKWLLENQQKDGCWDGGNIRSNAFLLYSLWPKSLIKDNGEPTPDNGCRESGYFCMISANCKGNILSDYACFGSQICCDTAYIEPTCSELGGKICGRDEYCQGDDRFTNGSFCCIGECEKVRTPLPEESVCVQNFGNCTTAQECGEGFVEANYECNRQGQICCIAEIPKKGGSLWILVLFILIFLIIIAIIYKDKLRMMIFKMSGKSDSSMNKEIPRRPGMPPEYHRTPQLRPPIQRKIIPQQKKPIRPNIRELKSNKELDDVLKKLKDMSQ